MSTSQYVENVYLTRLMSADFDREVGENWIPHDQMRRHFREALEWAFLAYNFDFRGLYDDMLNAHFKNLIEAKAVEIEGDEYTGPHSILNVAIKDKYLKDRLFKNPVTARIERLGTPALERALAALGDEENWPNIAVDNEDDIELSGPDSPSIEIQASSMEIPASDRMVTLQHNQMSDLEQATGEIIVELERENSIDGDPATRSWMLGQLKAGRELIRAQTLNVWLLEQTIFKLLGQIIDKFKDHAIGEAAKKLMELLIKHIFGGP